MDGVLRYVSLMWSLFLIRRLVFGWHIARLVIMRMRQNDKCYDETELHAQNMLFIQGSIINSMGVPI